MQNNLEINDIEEFFNYEDHRPNIRSGDLLIWSKDPSSSFRNFLLDVVRFFTKSEYGHVGIAWKIGGRLFVIEATIPRVRIVPVSDLSSFYHVPLRMRWKREYEDYLLEKVGAPYSMRDAIRAYFTDSVENDGTWQCAELANRFYSRVGIPMGNAFTPAKIVERLLVLKETAVYSIRRV